MARRRLRPGLRRAGRFGGPVHPGPGRLFQPDGQDLPRDLRVRDELGGELSFSISERGAIWAGGDYYSKVGKLGFTQDETKIRIVPLAAGVKYYFSGGRLRPYAGAGAAYFQYKETNSIGTIEKGDVGFVARAGLLVMLGPTFFMDVQGGWSTCSVQPGDVKANLGGLSLGLGLGFEF